MEKKLNDTQEYILSVLNSVIKATNEMNVKCYMQGGTMLGAIRHGGFIPWDDDVDLGIMRNEYEIFLKNVKKYLPGNLELRTYWDESDHHYYFARIVDKRYLIKRMGSAEIRYENVWVDIFPLDGMPSNIFALKVHQFRLALARLMYHLSCIKKSKYKTSWKIGN
ncbi:LicD family protein [Blautia massiliensis (ex Durand et al. 2017)]|uniref:LicD family protein n=1 Tax=Blautia massiliensis (ex Durand et al. 2017) TaxID=1737424 RepID=UPI003992D452